MKLPPEIKEQPIREKDSLPTKHIKHDHHLTKQLTALEDEAAQDGNIGGD